jgi:hypothetical protein
VFLIFFDRNTADSTTTWWDDRVLSKSLFWKILERFCWVHVHVKDGVDSEWDSTRTSTPASRSIPSHPSSFHHSSTHCQ